MFEKILVCLDGSKLAEQILPLAEGQALRFSSQVTLLQVVQFPVVDVIQAGATYEGVKTNEEHVQTSLATAKPYMEGAAQRFRRKSIPVEVVIQEGSDIGKAIVEFAEKHKVDLIAIATHGHGGLARLVLGSVAEHVLETSSLPMLMIRPKVS